MKYLQTFCGLLLLAAIGGCNQSTAPAPSPSPASATAERPAPVSTPPARPSRRLSQTQLKQIASTGKTGLWADPAKLCGKSSKRRVPITVAWHVESPVSAQLTLFRIGKDGKEHQIARGGSVGGRTISGSTQSTNVYVLRTQTGKEVGRVQVDGKQC
jgi:hypothetical protein